MLVVAQLHKPSGLKGWVNMTSFTEDPKDVFAFPALILGEREGGISLVIEAYQSRGVRYIVKFAGYDDRTAVEVLVNQVLSVAESALPVLGDQEYYWHELIGMSVYSQLQDGLIELGRVKHLMATGANDVLVVEPTASSIDDRERLLPYITSCVVSVDADKRAINVVWDVDF